MRSPGSQRGGTHEEEKDRGGPTRAWKLENSFLGIKVIYDSSRS